MRSFSPRPRGVAAARGRLRRQTSSTTRFEVVCVGLPCSRPLGAATVATGVFKQGLNVSMRAFDRILDAAFNRGREALRVLEDLYRFGRDDRAAQRLLKRLRHRLSALERPRALRLLAARDEAGDVGRGDDLSTRRGLGPAAAANFKRLQEALRSIEECAAGFDPALRGSAAALRFDAYEA